MENITPLPEEATVPETEPPETEPPQTTAEETTTAAATPTQATVTSENTADTVTAAEEEQGIDIWVYAAIGVAAVVLLAICIIIARKAARKK